MAKSKKTDPALAIDVAVSFGDVSIGDEICRLGLRILRTELSVSNADKMLVGKRLVGKIVAMAGNDNPDQPSLGMGTEEEINGAFDVKSIGVTRKKITTGLSFSIASIDVSVLAHFAKRSGRLQIEKIDDIPAKGQTDLSEDESEDDEE